MLARRYDALNFKQGKAACKAWLQARAGLPIRPMSPLFAQIGRLDAQKGWDLLAEVAGPMLERDVQLVVLGTGLPRYHELLNGLARLHREKVWAHLGFSDDLAHQVEAGADVFLMPSLFEPCGLNQLYSLAHGTVPLVRATGGLADTVVPVNPRTVADGTATGFSFIPATPHALWQAIETALMVWEDRRVWDQLIRNGMQADWSWEHSAGIMSGFMLRFLDEVSASLRIFNAEPRAFLLANNILWLECHFEPFSPRRFHVTGDLGWVLC